MSEHLKITYSVLVIDGNPKHARYIKAILDLAFDNIQVFIAETLDSATELMEYASIDIFIIEPYLNGARYNGADFAAELLAKSHLTQIIFQSHMEDLKYRTKLHKKFTRSPYILSSSLSYDQEIKDNISYSLDFLSMTATRKLVFDKKSHSFVFDVKEIEYVYKIPNEKAIAVRYLDQVTNEFKAAFIPNMGLTSVLKLLDVKQDLARVEDKTLINPLMIREVDHKNDDIIMFSGARINIGQTFRKTIGTLLNALKK